MDLPQAQKIVERREDRRRSARKLRRRARSNMILTHFPLKIQTLIGTAQAGEGTTSI